MILSIYTFLFYQYYIQLYFIEVQIFYVERISKTIRARELILKIGFLNNHILLKEGFSQSLFLPFFQRIPFQLKSWSLYVNLNKEIHF